MNKIRQAIEARKTRKQEEKNIKQEENEKKVIEKLEKYIDILTDVIKNNNDIKKCIINDDTIKNIINTFVDKLSDKNKKVYKKLSTRKLGILLINYIINTLQKNKQKIINVCENMYKDPKKISICILDLLIMNTDDIIPLLQSTNGLDMILLRTVIPENTLQDALTNIRINWNYYLQYRGIKIEGASNHYKQNMEALQQYENAELNADPNQEPNQKPNQESNAELIKGGRKLRRNKHKTRKHKTRRRK